MSDSGTLQFITAADVATFGAAHPHSETLVTFRMFIRPELIFCDEPGCVGVADAVHFQSEDGYYPHRGAPIVVRFSCPKHELAGENYWIYLDHLTERNMASHIAKKTWGLHGLASLVERLEEIEFAALSAWRKRHRLANRDVSEAKAA